MEFETTLKFNASVRIMYLYRGTSPIEAKKAASNFIRLNSSSFRKMPCNEGELLHLIGETDNPLVNFIVKAKKEE